jgi:hypothetical protein
VSDAFIPSDDRVDIRIPDFDPAKHAGKPLIEDAVLPADLPLTHTGDHKAPASQKVGENVYYQRRGGVERNWPRWMSDADVNQFLNDLALCWKDLWATYRAGLKKTLGLPGTVVLSQLEVERGKRVQMTYQAKASSPVLGDKLAPIMGTIGKGYDAIHDLHITVFMDRIHGVPYHGDSELKVFVIANEKTDDMKP